MPGHIEAIHIAPHMGEPVAAVDSVHAVAGQGLADDRIINDLVAQGKDVERKRQVTLVEAEAIEALERDCGIEFSAAETRRNLCTRGVALNHLVDREFTVGSVRLRGMELCEPCGLLEKMSGKRGVVKGLIHRGGLYAEILEGGTIRVGDAVTPD